jgi:DNA-binding MarR family transcriptional regulator
MKPGSNRTPEMRAAFKPGMDILIPKQLRLEWIDVMALDASLSHVAFRVAAVIAHHLNKHTGRAFLTQELIAQILGISERTVFAAIKQLEKRRYVIVKRREFGTIIRKTRTGRETLVRVAGGKGVANTYIPTVDGSQVCATNRGLKLAERCELMWEQRSQKSVPKVATSCEPTLSPPTEENPAPHGKPIKDGALGSIGAVIRTSIRDEEFRSWFGKATIADETAQVLALAFPNRFNCQEVKSRYGDKFESWCKKLGKQRIEIVWLPPR